MKIALFNFDGTITKHYTFRSFARFALGDVKYTAVMMAAMPVITGMALAGKGKAAIKEYLFGKLFKGMPADRFRKFGGLYADKLAENLRWSTMFHVKYHLRLGHRVIIVSASVGDWIRPWAYENGIEEIVATEVEIDKAGRLTGRFVTPVCRGSEKLSRLKVLVPDIESHEVWAYSDERGDDAMLALANHPNKI